MKKVLSCVAATAAMALMAACTTDQYDTGDGKYSYLRSDFALVNTDAQSRMGDFTTDERQTWTADGSPKVSWMTTPDSTYRALVYYATPSNSDSDITNNGMTDGNVTNSGTASSVKAVKVFAVQNVLCPEIKRWHSDMDTKTDPVRLEAMWLSTDHRYVNITFDVKTGSTTSDAEGQSIGATLYEVVTNANGTRTAHITFCHDQGGVPQYYSSRQYASLAVNQMQNADTAVVTVNTYDGTVKKTVALK